ncbi:hypothetical protein DIRU0_E09560 [Diutina rugosa]
MTLSYGGELILVCRNHTKDVTRIQLKPIVYMTLQKIISF